MNPIIIIKNSYDKASFIVSGYILNTKDGTAQSRQLEVSGNTKEEALQAAQADFETLRADYTEWYKDCVLVNCVATKINKATEPTEQQLLLITSFQASLSVYEATLSEDIANLENAETSLKEAQEGQRHKGNVPHWKASVKNWKNYIKQSRENISRVNGYLAATIQG